MNLLEGFISSEFNSARGNQGVALFPRLVQEVLARADMTELNARVTAPRLFDGTNDVDVEDGAVRLVGIVVDNTEAADNALTLYDSNTVTEGTTDPTLILEVPASSMLAVVFSQPISMAALSWSATDAGTTAIEAGTLAAANSLEVLFVYVENE
jgi:hypothetical protein